MYKIIEISVNGELYERFQMATTIKCEDVNVVLERAMREYTGNVFEMVSKQMKEPRKEEGSVGVVKSKSAGGRAVLKIPKWACSPNLNTHKIIRAFYAASTDGQTASLKLMRKFCSDPKKQDMYIEQFTNNYAQMKIDRPNSSGRVFEDDGATVSICESVKEVLENYRSYFE